MPMELLRKLVLSMSILMALNVVVKSLVTTNIKINEIGENDMKNGVRVIRRIDSIGLAMCIKECQFVFPCGAVNYKKDALLCEFVMEGGLETELEASPGWRYIPKTDMSGIFKSLGKCELNERYVEFKNNQAGCFPLNPTDLSFNDCRYTPGSGVYFININENTRIQARCQGEWMVFQQRTAGSTVSFAKNWNEYKQGFGNPKDDYWLGNENLYLYTSQGPSEMRVELETNDSLVFAEYSTLGMTDEQSDYVLTVTGYTGTAGDAFNNHKEAFNTNGKKFTTHDRDNNWWGGGNCAAESVGNWGLAWWYGHCSAGVLNQFRWMPLSKTETIKATKMLAKTPPLFSVLLVFRYKNCAYCMYTKLTNTHRLAIGLFLKEE